MQNLIRYRHEIIWTLLLISLPFSKALINVVLALAFLLFLYDVVKHKKRSFYKRQSIYIFVLAVVYLVINALLKGGFKDSESFFKLYPILIVGYFCFISIDVKNICKIQKISVLVCFVYVLTCLVRVLLHYGAFSTDAFGNSAIINHLLMLDRPYAGCYVMLNIMLVYNVFKTSIKNNEKRFLVFVLFVFTAFIVLIAARLSLLTLLALLVIYFVFYSNAKWLTKSLIVFGIPLIALLFIYISPGLQQRLFINKSFEVFKDYEPRFVIWDAVRKMVSSNNFNLFTGVGSYTKIDQLLIDYYYEIPNIEKRAYYLKEKFNTHNQFFDWLIYGGIFALILFVTFFTFLFHKVRKNFTSLGLVFGLVMFMMVENVFHRQVGCYLFFIYLIMALKINEKEANSLHVYK